MVEDKIEKFRNELTMEIAILSNLSSHKLHNLSY